MSSLEPLRFAHPHGHGQEESPAEAVNVEVGDQIQTSEYYGVASIRTTVWIERREQVHRDLTDQLPEVWVAGISSLANSS